MGQEEQAATASLTASITDQDIVAIRRVVADAEKYQVDPDPFIALHTADAMIVNIAGRRVLGRDTIYQAMKKALDTPLANVLTKIQIEEMRLASPDVAIVSCIKHVSDEREATLKDDPTASLPSQGRLTYIVVKEQNAWRIACAQTTPIINS